MKNIFIEIIVIIIIIINNNNIITSKITIITITNMYLHRKEDLYETTIARRNVKLCHQPAGSQDCRQT